MGVRRFLRKPLALTGLTALGYMGVRALLGLLPGADERFLEWSGPTLEINGETYGRVVLPVRYYRTDAFIAVFSADYDAVRAALPTPDLYPVRLNETRAAFVIAAFNYLHNDVGPYGEVLLGVQCTHRRKAPPILPLLAGYPGLGIFIFHLPVTTAVARDGGRQLYGYPKFVADMAFERVPAYQRVQLMEGDSHILTLTVKQRGFPIKIGGGTRTFTVLDGQLIQTTIPIRSVYQLSLVPGSGTLTLGDHAIAAQLRELDVSTGALMTRNYLSHVALLPPGEPVGSVPRAYPGHSGRDIEAGRLTLRYDPHRDPVVLHPASDAVEAD